MQIVWIIGIGALIVLFLFLKQYKKETKQTNDEEPAEPIKVNNKGCSIAFYIFFAILIGVFVYYIYIVQAEFGIKQ